MSTMRCLFIGGIADGTVREVPLNHMGNPPAEQYAVEAPRPLGFDISTTRPAPLILFELYVGERIIDRDGSEWIVYCHGSARKSPLGMLIQGYRRPPGGRADADKRPR